MNHSDIRARMADYLDGELSLDKRALFDGHLDHCEDCGREFDEMKATIQLLRGLPDPEPPASLVDDVMRRIREGEGQQTFLERALAVIGDSLIPRVALPAAALAAALAAVVVVGDLPFPPGVQSPNSPPPTLAAGAAARTAERGADRATTQLAKVTQPGNPGSRLEELAARFTADRVEPINRQRRTSGPYVFGIDQSFLGGGLGATTAPPYMHGGVQNVSARQERFGPYDPQRMLSAPATTASGGTDSLAGAELPKEERRRVELDSRLAALIADPVRFTREFSMLSVAEQELWLKEFASRAVEQDEQAAVMRALLESGDVTAESLAAVFAKAVEANRAASVASASSVVGESSPTRSAEPSAAH